MKITGVTTHLLSSNWAADRRAVGGHGGGYKSSALVRVETDAGITGLGEIIIGYFAPEAVPTLVDYYIPHLIGKDPLQTTAALEPDVRDRASGGAARGRGVGHLGHRHRPLGHQGQGPRRAGPHAARRADARADAGRTRRSAAVPDDLDEAVTAVRRWVDEGYRAVKLGQFSNDAVRLRRHRGRLHRPPGRRRSSPLDAAARFGKLRDAFGPTVDFIIHNHMGSQAWPLPMNLNEAVRVLQALEPVGAAVRRGAAAVRGHRRATPTCASGPPRRSPAARCWPGSTSSRRSSTPGALDIVQPDVSFCGGITTTWEVMQLASANFIRTALHMGGSFGPAYAAGLHLSFAHKDAIILETLPVALPTIREVLQFPLELRRRDASGRRRRTCRASASRSTRRSCARHPFVPGSGERG